VCQAGVLASGLKSCLAVLRALTGKESKDRVSIVRWNPKGLRVANQSQTNSEPTVALHPALTRHYNGESQNVCSGLMGCGVIMVGMKGVKARTMTLGYLDVSVPGLPGLKR
jgi:hypothetical protein